MKRLHFTIGPVQGFVAQARRTRDLWAGSFLLSWLSGRAMKAVLDDCEGRIVFPDVENDPMLKGIRDKKSIKEGREPFIGSLPNRFLAEIPEDRSGETVELAVREAWKNLADGVFEKYVKPVLDKDGVTEDIWNEQVVGFWEIAWAEGAEPDLLDQRKNWRTHVPPAFKGEQCTIMADWREISGYLRIHNRKKQDEFWKALREKNSISDMEMRENERLCAVALIKRLFHNVAEERIGWQVDVANWPGTPYMAALPFVVRAVNKAKDQCQAYNDLVRNACLKGVHGEWKTKVASLPDHARKAESFTGLDGDFFHVSAIKDSATRIPVLGPRDSDERKRVVEELEKLQKDLKCEASPYYAILLMDGDRLGAQLQAAGDKACEISKALAEFTKGVPGCVADWDGVTVYAGGDDVLAILPLPRAIDAAEAVKKLYLEAFSGVDLDEDVKRKCTISAGIALAHFSHPLTDIMREAHHLLDHVAKNPAHGDRDALAVGVFKAGALHSRWVSKWAGVDRMGEFLSLLEASDPDQGVLSNSFLYRFRELVRLLDDKPHREIGENYVVPDGLNLKSLVMADMVKGWEARGQSDRDDEQQRAEAARKASEVADKLLGVCGYDSGPEGDKKFSPDGLFVARFIAKEEVG